MASLRRCICWGLLRSVEKRSSVQAHTEERYQNKEEGMAWDIRDGRAAARAPALAACGVGECCLPTVIYRVVCLAYGGKGCCCV